MSHTKSTTGKALSLSVEKNRSYGFVIVALVVLIVVGSGYGVYAASRNVVGVYQFNKAVTNISEGDTLDDVENRIASAFEISRNDIFAREIALYRLSELRTLLATESPDADTQQAFSNAVSKSVQAAQLAVELDPTDPYNNQVLGQIYAVLAIVGVEGAKDKALELLQVAKKYDPQNPIMYLIEADMALQLGDTTSARSYAEQAVTLRSNYTEALFLLAQLDIDEGNTERALIIVNGITQLEPQNPARRYQLGVLLASANRLDEAIAAFEEAVALDPQYANARYFLALGYAEKGQINEAIEQLSIVRDLNETNTVVDELINQLRTTGSLDTSLSNQNPVGERSVEEGGVTESDLETDLVTSSNPLPENTNEETAIVE